MHNYNADQLKKIFNARTTTIDLGTSNLKGEVNVAPVGSACITGDNTITLLRGPLKRTYMNLQENPNAVFVAVNNKLNKWLKFFFTGEFGESHGYRIYVRLREERDVTEDEKLKVMKERFGSVALTKGGRKIRSLVNKALVFDILQVREITPFD